MTYLLTYPRETIPLDGTWQAIPNQYENFEAYFEDFVDDEEPPFDPIYGPSASVENDPRDFNIYDGYSVEIPSSWGTDIPEFRHYEGWVWYATQLDRSAVRDGDRAFLRFGAVNYQADVWLNGKHVGSHEGGYTPLSFEVTGHSGRGNVIPIHTVSGTSIFYMNTCVNPLNPLIRSPIPTVDQTDLSPVKNPILYL